MRDSPSTLPVDLTPGEDIEYSLPTGRRVGVHSYRADFHETREKPAIGLDRAYSAHALVLVDKQAMFPEIALLGMFAQRGWQGAWVDASHRKYFDKMPNQSKGVSLGTHANLAVTRIAEYNDKSKAGCWDLILWTERSVQFVAVLAPGETLGEARTRWLAAALRSGFSANQFMVVEWDLRKVVVRRKRHGAP
jgi:hypothetical protein